MLKLFRLIRPYRSFIAIVLVLALAQSLANLFLPRLMSEIVDRGIVKGDARAILSIGVLMLLMALVGTGCAIAGSYFSAKIATGFGRIVRGEIFDRVAHFSVHQFDRFSNASLITRTTNDTTQVQQVLIMMLTMVITAPMMAIGGVIMALSQDAELAWVLIAVIPVMAVVFVLIMRGAIPLFQVMQVKIDRLNLVLDEGLSGVRVISAFDRSDHQHARFDAANLDLTNTAIAANRLIAFLMPAMIVMLNSPASRLSGSAAAASTPGRWSRRDDRVAAVRDADPVRGFHGHRHVRHAAARLGVGRQNQRSAGRRTGSRRSGAAGGDRPGRGTARPRRVPERHLPVSGRRRTGAGRRVVRGAGRRDDRDHRRHRLGQVDARRADSAFLRREPGAHPGGWRRRPRTVIEGSARPDRLRAAESRAVHRHRRREYPLRPRRCPGRRGA
jgi:hypothetical protein